MERFDLVIVGMGSGGMTAAEFAAQLGLRVAVVERGRVGGDCLWTGCVPSKALIASARVAHAVRTGPEYGLPLVDLPVDTRAVWDRIHRIQREIAATDDDPARYSAMGVEIIDGHARLESAHEVVVDDARRITTRFVLLCTGSRPKVPAIAGLAEVGFLTSESIFELEQAPRSIVFLGGGPIGIELAQALTRLGVEVTVLQNGDRIMARDEPELVRRLHAQLQSEGVDIRVGARIDGVQVSGGEKLVRGVVHGEPHTWRAKEVFVATGRVPNVEDLGLDRLGVTVGDRGVVVDERLRSTVPTIYAAGDVAGRFLFTHSAGYEAVRAVRDMFFPGRGRADAAVPWCTFTDPELAHTGLTPAEAVERYGRRAVRVWRHDLTHSDRARTDGSTLGGIVIVTAKRKIVGGHILAPAAGELIHELALAIRERCTLASLGGLVHVYPTLATGVQQLGGESAFEQARQWRWLVRRPHR